VAQLLQLAATAGLLAAATAPHRPLPEPWFTLRADGRSALVGAAAAAAALAGVALVVAAAAQVAPSDAGMGAAGKMKNCKLEGGACTESSHSRNSAPNASSIGCKFLPEASGTPFTCAPPKCFTPVLAPTHPTQRICPGRCQPKAQPPRPCPRSVQWPWPLPLKSCSSGGTCCPP
jgi:hypothetical protein